MIYTSADQLIGNTPLLEMVHLEEKYELKAKIAAKLEYLNPAGSVKDRVALEMIVSAEQKGLLKPGATIIEPTSGNTGIGIASVAASRGYKAILTMPDTMSRERRLLLAAYGAKVVLTDGKKGMNGAIEKAHELAREIPGSIVAGQFENPANPAAHQKTTGPEIWRDTDGKVDLFVAGVGTGGTITGVGEFLNLKIPTSKLWPWNRHSLRFYPAVRPARIESRESGRALFLKILNPRIYDEIITVDDEAAMETARELAKCEGILVGISSGAAMWAALLSARDARKTGAN